MYTGNLISELMNTVEVAERRLFDLQDAEIEESLESWYVQAHQQRGQWESNLAGVA